MQLINRGAYEFRGWAFRAQTLPMTDTTPSATAGKAGGAATLVASALSNQLGAATASLAFPVIGPVGVVAVRQLVAAAVLLHLVRPRLRDLAWRQWWPVLLLAVSFGTMNLGLYASVQRIGLGLAVTLEFLGPLAVALASSRQKTSALRAVGAAAQEGAITNPEASTDFVGIGFGLVAACSGRPTSSSTA